MKITPIFLMAVLMGCTNPKSVSTEPTLANVKETVSTPIIPDGFSVVEKQPDGYFIRLASAERASKASIRSLSSELAESFDRIDLCLITSSERGEEYASIINGQVFDYENDKIYSLN